MMTTAVPGTTIRFGATKILVAHLLRAHVIDIGHDTLLCLLGIVKQNRHAGINV